MIQIVDKIDLASINDYLESPESGGAVIFIGSVRNNAKGKRVEKLVFEAYAPMAIKQMEKIADEAKANWALQKLVMVHAVGEMKVGEMIVVTGASSAHRKEAFEACRYLIDELKKTVPIWKKEYYEDESVWVNAHP